MRVSVDFESVRAERDPLAQARHATELIALYQQRSVELARLRKQAIEQAVRDTGMSFSAVAQSVGLSKGRVTQIRQSAPPPERALFGVGPITVAIPLRSIEGRALGVIAAEDSLSAERLTTYLHSLQFQVHQQQIPLDGQWRPPDDAVAICGPRSSSVTAEAIDSDRFLVFGPDTTGVWSLRDRATDAHFGSPMDAGDPSADIAYVGRVRYRSSTLLVIAGVHALGSLGAVHYLTEHAGELFDQVQTSCFSLVVRTDFDGLDPIRHEILAPARSHDG
ncbi:MAG TPA: hypothetical protein VFP34_06285 [Microlunatus sp.]|nr:hypothetical protein [Microlunatus sp.]